MDLTNGTLSISGGNDVDLSGYLTAETDPSVGSQTADHVARWDGSQLVAGSITDNGADVGIGTASPAFPLDVYADRVGVAVVDQSQASSPFAAGGTDVWQSFTAGADGRLTQLVLNIGRALDGSQPGVPALSDVTVTVYAGEGTAGPALASEVVQVDNNIPGRRDVDVVFAEQVMVTTGQMYSYRLQTPQVTVTNVLFQGSNPYPGGRSSFVQPDRDLHFTTLVAPVTNERALFVDDGAVNIGVLARLEPQVVPPVNPRAGDIYFDGTLGQLRYYDGTAWVGI